MNFRYVFTNIERWGGMTDKSYRRWSNRVFDWFGFNYEVVKEHCGKEIIAVSNPSYIKKSGKRTFRLGMFWTGVRQKALKGLEIGCLAFVDVDTGTGLHGEAVQTPSSASLKAEGKTLVDHYVSIIIKRIADIKAITNYLAVDGYLYEEGIYSSHIERWFKYNYYSPQRCQPNVSLQKRAKKGRSRKKIYDGKINTQKNR